MRQFFDHMSLRQKFVFGTIFIVTFLAMSLGLVARIVFENTLNNSLAERAKTLASGLIAGGLDNVLLNDKVQLRQCLKDAQKRDPSISYIIITDEEGVIMAHSFDGDVPPDIASLVSKRSEDVWLDTEKGKIKHVTVSVTEDLHPILAVGLNSKSNSEMMDRLTLLFPFVTGLAFLICITLAVWLGDYISKPIQDMAFALQRVGRGEVVQTLNVDRKDELGMLAMSFADMQEALRRSREEAELAQRNLIQTEKMSALGTFVAGMAHQINNPLGGIITCIDMIEQTDDQTKIRTYVALARRSAMRLKEVVERIITFSKESKGVIHARVNLNDVVNEGINIVQHEAKRKRIDVDTSLEHGGCLCIGDPHDLTNAFINLFINAIQASPEGGKIWIRTRQNDGLATLEVEDSGKGVHETYRERIFEPFFTTKPDGTGLGLYVVYEVARKHKGEIMVKDGSFGGALFILSLPCDSKQEG